MPRCTVGVAYLVRVQRSVAVKPQATLLRRQHEQEHWSSVVFSVRPDRFDHQVEFTVAVDVARITVRLIRLDALAFFDANPFNQ